MTTKSCFEQISLSIFIILVITTAYILMYSNFEVDHMLNAISIFFCYGSVLAGASKIFRSKREKLRLAQLDKTDLGFVKQKMISEYFALTDEEIKTAREELTSQQDDIYKELLLLEDSEKVNDAHVILSIALVAVAATCQLLALTI
jgi:hypothetical protein